MEQEELIVEGWKEVLEFIDKRFQKGADLKAILFIIGLQEIGKQKTKYTKEEKEDLMNLAACTILSLSGYFSIMGRDKDGWPIWKQDTPVPAGESVSQEKLLMEHVVKYFREKNMIG